MTQFRKLTTQQRDTLAALRALGEMVVTPRDARPLKTLARRGWVRYRKVDGVRTAIYRHPVAQAAEVRRLKRTKRWFGWPIEECRP